MYSCDDDVEASGSEPVPSCTQADWIGTYTGTNVCNTNPDTLDVTITITANGDNIDVNVDEGNLGFDTDFFGINLDGCRASQAQSDGIVSVTVNGTLTGDDLVLTSVITFDGEATTCVGNATKQ